MTSQSWSTAFVDIAYWIIVCLLGKWGILNGQVIAALLSGYSAYRFGVAHSKQQTQTAIASQSSRGMPAVVAAIAETPQRSEETFPPEPPDPPPGAPPLRNAPRRIPGSGPLVPPEAAGGPPDRRARAVMLFPSPLVQLVQLIALQLLAVVRSLTGRRGQHA